MLDQWLLPGETRRRFIVAAWHFPMKPTAMHPVDHVPLTLTWAIVIIDEFGPHPSPLRAQDQVPPVKLHRIGARVGFEGWL